MASANDIQKRSQLNDVIDVHAAGNEHTTDNFSFHVGSDLPEMMLDWEAALAEMPVEDKELLGM